MAGKRGAPFGNKNASGKGRGRKFKISKRFGPSYLYSHSIFAPKGSVPKRKFSVRGGTRAYSTRRGRKA